MKIYYETLGNPRDPCIVLIPGLGGQLTDWPPSLTQGLAQQGFFVVIFDNRDSGLSHSYDELGTPNFNEVIALRQQGKTVVPPYTLEDMASDVIQLLDELQVESAHIVGSSMGGFIAQYVAMNFRNRALSLTCIATSSGDPSLPPAKREVMEFFASSMNVQNQSKEDAIDKKLKLFKIYNHPDTFDEETVKKQLTASFNRAHNPNGFKRLLFAMICAEPRTDRLKQLKIPCLIVHGDCDPVFSIEHAKHLEQTIPGSHLEIIEKMGHGLPDSVCMKLVEVMANYYHSEFVHGYTK